MIIDKHRFVTSCCSCASVMVRIRNTVEFMGLWETLKSLNCKHVKLDTFRKQAGLNNLYKKWSFF
jgi:hypothetical protein